jgi:hypothetical protein
VAGDGKQVAADGFDIDRYLSGSLDRVGMKPDLSPGWPQVSDQPSDLFDGL